METVFDLGFHNGDDTAIYLQKGYRVVAVEANLDLVEAGRRRFADAIAREQLFLLHLAISDSIGPIKFYVHPEKSDWSSCIESKISKDGTVPIVREVCGIRLERLYLSYGVPLYIKCDIEGMEEEVAKQIALGKEKPRYVSFECSKDATVGILYWLSTGGYSGFQLRNQLNNPPYTSGPFGDELPENKWIEHGEALYRYEKYQELKQLDPEELGLGWLDVHGRL